MDSHSDSEAEIVVVDAHEYRLQTDAAEAAVRQAEAEGLTLQLSDNISGYRAVTEERRGKAKSFFATVRRVGAKVHLGSFTTAEEAALAYARTPEAQAQVANPRPPKSAPLTAAEVMAQVVAEGLALQRSSNASGYRGVCKDSGCRTLRYKASLKRAGKDTHLGNFATAEEAALAYARTLEAQGELASKPSPLTAEEAVVQATAEGLTLEPGNNTTGYKGVTARGGCSRYEAQVRLGGKSVTLGRFDTAEEAALAVARATKPADPPSSPAAKSAAPPPPEPPSATHFDSDDGIEIEEVEEVEEVNVEVIEENDVDEEQDAMAATDASEAQANVATPNPALLTAEEAVAQATAERLTLVSGNGATGYKGVSQLRRRYLAYVYRAGQQVQLGFFGNAEEAALAVARATAAAPAAAPSRAGGQLALISLAAA